MALYKARAAGEACAHGEPAIGAKLMEIAAYYMRGVIEAATRPFVEADHKKRYLQALNPGGRPTNADRGDAWLTAFEAARNRPRPRTAWEIYGDIAQAHKESTGTDCKASLVQKEVSKARSRRRAEQSAKGTFR